VLIAHDIIVIIIIIIIREVLMGHVQTDFWLSTEFCFWYFLFFESETRRHIP